MADKKRKLVVELLGDNDNLSKSLGDTESKLAAMGAKVQDVGKKMMGTGAVMTAGITAPLALFAKGAVSAFAEAEQSNAQMEASLKSTGATAWTSSEAMDALAGSMQDKLGIDGDLIKSGQSVLLTFTNVQNKVGEGNDIFDRATQTAADMSVKLGTDLPQANMLLGKALNDPIKGMSALSRAGVQLSEDQQNLVRQMVETGDVTGAQKVLLEELEKQFGGSAEAAGNTAAGGMEKLRLKFEDIQESIGERLVPIFEKLGDWIGRGLALWDRLGEKGQTIALVMAGVAAAIGPVVTVVGALVTAVGFLISPVGLVIAAVAGLAAAFVFFYKNNEGFRDWVNGVVQAVRDRLVTAFEFLRDVVLPTLVDAFMRIRDRVQPMLEAAFGWLSDVALPKLQEGFAWLVEKMQPVLQALGEFLPVVFQRVVDVILMTAEVIKRVVAGVAATFEWLQPVIEKVWGVIVEQIETAITFVQAIIKTVTSVLSGDWAAAWEGIKAAAGAVWDGIVSLVRGALGILGQVVSNALPVIGNALAGLWDWIKGAAGNALEGVIGFFADLPRRILNTIGAIGQAAASIGSTIASKIGDGIGAVFGMVGDLATKLWNGIRGFINDKIIEPINGFQVSTPFGNLDFPNLPRLHTGGVVPGRGEVPVILEAGESVRSAEQERRLQSILGGVASGGAGGPNIEIHIHGPVAQDSVGWVADRLADAVRQGMLHSIVPR